MRQLNKKLRHPLFSEFSAFKVFPKSLRTLQMYDGHFLKIHLLTTKVMFFSFLELRQFATSKNISRKMFSFPGKSIRSFFSIFLTIFLLECSNSNWIFKNWLENLKLFFKKSLYFYRKPLCNVSEIFRNFLRILRKIVIDNF